MQKFIKENGFGLIKCALINVMLFFYILLGAWGGMNILNVFVFLAYIFIEIYQKYIKKIDEQSMPIFEKFISWAFIPLSILLILDFGFFPIEPSLLLMALWYFLYVLIIKTYFPIAKTELKTSKLYAITELIIYIAIRAAIVFGFLICVIFLGDFNTGDAFSWVSYSFFLIASFAIAVSYVFLAIENIEKIKHLAKAISEKYKVPATTDTKDDEDIAKEKESGEEEIPSAKVEAEISKELKEDEQKKSTPTETEDVVEVEVEILDEE